MTARNNKDMNAKYWDCLKLALKTLDSSTTHLNLDRKFRYHALPTQHVSSTARVTRTEP